MLGPVSCIPENLAPSQASHHAFPGGQVQEASVGFQPQNFIQLTVHKAPLFSNAVPPPISAGTLLYLSIPSSCPGGEGQ